MVAAIYFVVTRISFLTLSLVSSSRNDNLAEAILILFLVPFSFLTLKIFLRLLLISIGLRSENLEKFYQNLKR
ncbi:hypothetical protein MCELHM10_00648 [Paracoccaceae bacterium]